MAQNNTAKKEKQFTPAEKIKYHNEKAKVGATKVVTNSETGKKETRVISDFERGRHKEKADTIVKARQRVWRKHNNGFKKKT